MKSDQKSVFRVVSVVGYRFRNGVLIELLYELALMINNVKGELRMKREGTTKPVAKVAVKVLDKVLRTEINSTSCIVFYQPKAPAKLEKFKK